MKWEKARLKMGFRKWVCWGAGAWITQHQKEPHVLHIGFNNEYLRTWGCTMEEAQQRLEAMHRKRLENN